MGTLEWDILNPDWLINLEINNLGFTSLWDDFVAIRKFTYSTRYT